MKIQDIEMKGEKYYKVKVVSPDTNIFAKNSNGLGGVGILHTHKKIDDAWAFCATTSIISSARKITVFVLLTLVGY